MEILSLNIGKIQIIVHKREIERFDFTNKSRSWDGFVMFTEGEGCFFSPDGDCVAIHPGDLVLLRRGDNYRFVFNAGCSYVTSAFHFLVDENEFPKLPRVVKTNEHTSSLILRMAKAWSRRKYESEIESRCMLLELYKELCCDRIYSGAVGAEGIVRKALDFIHASFKTSFSSGQIASACGCSPSYLRAIFARYTGMSVNEYRDKLRIDAAKEMLRSDIFAIKEIAGELGFCDGYYFSKCFTSAVGTSPAKYRSTHS